VKAVEDRAGKVVRDKHDISWLNSYLSQLKSEQQKG
jgi:hypothetical protein